MSIPDVPMPPWLRRKQQTWAWQYIGLPLTGGFFTALLAYGCFAAGIFHMKEPCIESALTATVFTFIGSVLSGHSPDSASFNPDGTKNKTVAAIAELARVDPLKQPRPEEG